MELDGTGVFQGNFVASTGVHHGRIKVDDVFRNGVFCIIRNS